MQTHDVRWQMRTVKYCIVHVHWTALVCTRAGARARGGRVECKGQIQLEGRRGCGQGPRRASATRVLLVEELAQSDPPASYSNHHRAVQQTN